MIISLKEDFDRELGTSLPMISRAGKSTIPEHLCFINAPGYKKEVDYSRNTKIDDNTVQFRDRLRQEFKPEMQPI